jgi:hypothetical protein
MIIRSSNNEKLQGDGGMRTVGQFISGSCKNPSHDKVIQTRRSG